MLSIPLSLGVVAVGWAFHFDPSIMLKCKQGAQVVKVQATRSKKKKKEGGAKMIQERCENLPQQLLEELGSKIT